MAQNKFIKGLTEKLTMLVDDWFIIQPDAEEKTAYKIKQSNALSSKLDKVAAADQSVASNVEFKKNVAIQRIETSDAPIHIGNLTDTIVANPAVLVQRGIDVGAGTSGHAFVDQSIVTSAESGYNSFDSRVDFINTASISHYAGFQTRLHLDGSGLVPNVYGFYHNNPIGSGPVTNHYGLYIEQLNAGTVTNYSIYTVGSTPSVFGGKVRIGSNDAPTVALDITGEMSMTGTSFIHDSNGSAYHIIDRGASLSHDAFIWYKTGGVSKWLAGIGVSGGDASNEDYRITDGSTTRFKIEQSTGNVEIDKNILIKGQAKAIGGFGESVAFSEAIKADAQGYFPDYTQTGVLNFTKDASVVDNKGYGNGVHGIITASGDAWNLTSDFDVIGDIAVPTAGEKYALTAIWR